MNLGGLVTRNAEMMPDKEALIFERERYTWYQVNDLVNRFANILIDSGLKKGNTVLLWMENSDLFVIAFYAVVKAGGIAVPVNYRLAPPEAEYIFTHSDAVALVFDDVFEPIIRDLEPDLRWPDDQASEPHQTGLIVGGAIWDLRKAFIEELGEEEGHGLIDFLYMGAIKTTADVPSVYESVLLADDDNGNLADGTPNAGEIFDAFDLHEIANAAVPTSPHCPRPAQPTLTVTPQCDRFDLSWSGVGGVDHYEVFYDA